MKCNHIKSTHMFPAKFRTPVSFRLFDDAITRDLFNHPHKMRAGYAPSVNVRESREGFDLEFAVPGFSKENFSVQFEKDVLTVSATTAHEKHESREGYSRREWQTSAFTRSFAIPEDVVKEGISAAYENGVLRVKLPRNAAAEGTDAKKTIVVS